MKLNRGDVYFDNLFKEEATIVSVDSDMVILDGPVGDSEVREADRWRVEHNINVGRYEKVEEDKGGVFDY
jgi:hypothetical protein